MQIAIFALLIFGLFGCTFLLGFCFANLMFNEWVRKVNDRSKAFIDNADWSNQTEVGHISGRQEVTKEIQEKQFELLGKFGFKRD